MVKLTREDVLKLARLAQLHLSEEEIEKFRLEISEILEYVAQLNSVDVNSIEPTSQVTGLTNVMREDVVFDYGISKAELLKNVPDTKDGLIKVKRTLA